MSKKLEFNTLPKNPELAESFDVFLCNEYSLPSFAISFLKNETVEYKARVDDIYVVSYPKTGTTWLQQIVYLIQNGVDHAASNADMNEKFPYIEHAKTNFDQVKEMPSPRLLKTHLPYSLLPEDIIDKKCKMIYITRNPRDVAVSYYHFACMLRETQYKGTFQQFFNRFIQNRATYSPFAKHNAEFWHHREDENILFLFYEDLKTDFAGNVKKISAFLNKSLTPEEHQKLAEHCNFKEMAKKADMVIPPDSVVDGKPTKFFRKGEVGDWKNYFDEDMVHIMNKQIDEDLNKINLQYTYEI